MDSSKHFLTGLSPSPPPNHVWQEWIGYSIYAADQHRSIWSKHSHDCTQLTIALDPASVCAEWQNSPGRPTKRELNGDMIWVVPPGLSHSVSFNRRASLIHLYLSDPFFERVTQNTVIDVSSKLSPALLVRDPFLVEMAKDLSEELRFGPLSELFSQSVAAIAVSHLIRRYSSKPNALPIYRGGLGPAREKRVRQYIQEHLDAQLSLEGLARIADISPNHFAALFRQTIGTTPHKFVVRQRVERARHLLERSRLPLIDIAVRCGFQDQSQFTTTFRRYLGTTPGRYKREL
jgi:AraC family transcriptional regulator